MREQVGRLIWPLTWNEQEYGTTWDEAEDRHGRADVLEVADVIINLVTVNVTPSTVNPNGTRRFVGYRPQVPAHYVAGGYGNLPGEAQYEGVIFGDGTTVVRWLTEFRSTSVWASYDELMKVHGHADYGTVIAWLDAPNAGEAIPPTTAPHPALPDANPSSSLPVDDPPCGCACHDGTGDTQFCACDEHEPSVLSLEDRLYVALAARGEQRIGQFIENALVGWRNAGIQFFYISDEQFVEALEYAAFGDEKGLHRAERDEVRVVDTPR